jgi:ATP-dependent 26S proteasome regulatory subunit
MEHPLRELNRHRLEFLQVQEDYIKDEQKNLKREYLHAQEEVKRIQSVPLVIGRRLPFSPPPAHIQIDSAKFRGLLLCNFAESRHQL